MSILATWAPQISSWVLLYEIMEALHSFLQCSGWRNAGSVWLRRGVCGATNPILPPGSEPSLPDGHPANQFASQYDDHHISKIYGDHHIITRWSSYDRQHAGRPASHPVWQPCPHCQSYKLSCQCVAARLRSPEDPSCVSLGSIGGFHRV